MSFSRGWNKPGDESTPLRPGLQRSSLWNLRAAPSFDGAVVGVVAEGDAFDARPLAGDGAWLEVVRGGETAYASRRARGEAKTRLPSALAGAGCRGGGTARRTGKIHGTGARGVAMSCTQCRLCASKKGLRHPPSLRRRGVGTAARRVPRSRWLADSPRLIYHFIHKVAGPHRADRAWHQSVAVIN